MLVAILSKEDPDTERLIHTLGKYTIGVTSYPGQEYKRVLLDTECVYAIRAIMHVESLPEYVEPKAYDKKTGEYISPDTLTRRLQTLLQAGNRVCESMFGSSGWSLELYEPKLETVRGIYYSLTIGGMDVYSKDEDILSMFADILPDKIIDLYTSKSIKVPGVPSWYTEGIIEETPGLTKYSNHVSTEMLDEISNILNERIKNSISMGLFPKSTPQEFIESHDLVRTPSGMYESKIKGYVGEFSEYPETVMYFHSAESLYTFAHTFSDKIGKVLRLAHMDDMIKVVWHSRDYLEFIYVLGLRNIPPWPGKCMIVLYNPSPDAVMVYNTLTLKNEWVQTTS